MAPDILVIGGGVFGLSAALAAHRAGLRVRVIEAEQPGAGASGGIVGALTPHAPSRWRPMMAFQFAALRSLASHAAGLTAATGLETGYCRTGRVVPIASEKAHARALKDVAAAPGVWGEDGRLEVLEAGAVADLSAKAGPFGVLHDTVSARISPRAYLSALRAALPANAIRRGRVLAVRPGPRAETGAGRIAAAHIVVAAGWRGWSLLPPALHGSGVKGQAALLRVSAGSLPIVTEDGLYIVPHADGTVAVGSTSEKRWTDPGPDAALDDVLDRARALVPLLAGAPVIERWAGIRPRPPGREPVVGPVPGTPGLWVAGGGYKIGFGIAHAVGEALVGVMLGQPAAIPVPDTFDPAIHCGGAPA